MKYLFDYWEEIKMSFERGIILLTDYDGTLTPIVDKPELALLSEDTRVLLREISGQYPIAIISGRSLADIKDLVGVDGIYYAGNHGLEISGPGLDLKKPEADRTRPLIAKICNQLQDVLGHIEGAIVENKGLTASVHYRLVSDVDFYRLENVFKKVIHPYLSTGKIRMNSGKKVFEIRPNLGWNKGKAARWMIDSVAHQKDSLPIYIGDDRTDEDAFAALKDHGITILVSEKIKSSNAEYFLRNVGEVRVFLEKLTCPPSA